MSSLIDATRSTLILVDLQARLMPAIHQGDELVERALILAQAARLLDIPVLGTEQNPPGLGQNLPEIRALCDRTIAKTHFGAAAEPQLAAALDPNRGDLVIAGCEAHVCVLQTVLGLIERDHRVRLVIDAVGSRRATDRAAAVDRADAAGAELVTTEMVIFEWLRHSDHPAFKPLLRLIR